jgi:hypothetical protein|tara:strand:- start:290 stop:472 length:183 start_codon:yes stop_codon:yes gene_type:complete
MADYSLKAFASSLGIHGLPEFDRSISTATDQDIKTFNSSVNQFTDITLYEVEFSYRNVKN